jgi:ribosomal protein S18 acetylase RimI-like enzyme
MFTSRKVQSQPAYEDCSLSIDMDTKSPPTVKLRTAGPDDTVAISSLGARVFSTTFGHSVTPQQLQDYLDEAYSITATAADIADPNKDMIVAVNQDDTVVGFGLLTRGSSEPCIAHLEHYVELQRLYVDLNHHGQGTGKLLAKHLEQMALGQGFKYMWLGVWEENHKAQKVYEKLGYTVVGDHVFDIGGDIQTDQIMLKQLV